MQEEAEAKRRKAEARCHDTMSPWCIYAFILSPDIHNVQILPDLQIGESHGSNAPSKSSIFFAHFFT